MNDYRPSWDEYGLALAKTVSLRADCRRSQVGAVLMREDHSIASVGYVGVGRGEEGCLSGGCPRGLLSYEELAPLSSYDEGPGRCISLHAEMNCLAQAREDTSGMTMYITRSPCPMCQRVMRAHRLAMAVWPEGRLEL